MIKKLLLLATLLATLTLSYVAFPSIAFAQEPSSKLESTSDDSAIDEVKDTELFKDFIIPGVNVFSSGVIILIVGAISFSGIQYAASRDDPQMAADAKKRITAALIALAVYMFFYSFMQWIIPGGIFG